MTDDGRDPFALPAAHWSSRTTRRALRDFIERQSDWVFATEGALCQAEDGECV